MVVRLRFGDRAVGGKRGRKQRLCAGPVAGEEPALGDACLAARDALAQVGVRLVETQEIAPCGEVDLVGGLGFAVAA